MKKRTIKEALDSLGMKEGDNRMESIVDQKDLHAFRQAASAIMDDLIKDGFEDNDIIEFLNKHIYSSEAENAKGIDDYEERQGSEMASHDASLYEATTKKRKYIYDNAGVSQKGLIKEAIRLKEMAGIASQGIDPRDVHNVTFDDVHHWDRPDYSDAYIDYAEHSDGSPYTEQELEMLNDDSDFVHDLLMDYLN